MSNLIWTNGDRCIRTKRMIDTNVSFENQESNEYNKRDIVNNKLNERSKIYQINQNPFLFRNDYLHDLDIQESFLKSQDSNYKKN